MYISTGVQVYINMVRHAICNATASSHSVLIYRFATCLSLTSSTFH